MPIEYRKGDVLKALSNEEIDILAHGVNCSGGFGSGIAGQIAKEYPIVKQEYLYIYNTISWRLGKIQIVDINKRLIINCATQQYYGRDPQSQPNNRYCDYEAISKCMAELYKLVYKENLKIGIPRIGCGLAGGNWDIVEAIINEAFSDYTIYVYDLK